MAQLTIENLSFTYPLCDEPVLRNISAEITDGEFVAVCGATGSGKSTLLRLMKREAAPLGKISGRILFDGIPTDQLDAHLSASSIGFVMQKPEQQIVTDKVWHELAFGLENMNVPQDVIARRIAEMAAYFGIDEWFGKNTAELSGGQKQLLNLASVMVMQPGVLLLDEPTSQLDPITASEFIGTVKKLNRELGLTVVIVEHRLEEVIPLADKLLVIENGGVFAFDTPQRVIGELADKPDLLCAMPSAARLYHRLGGNTEPCPLDVRGGRDFIRANYKNNVRLLPDVKYKPPKTPAVEFRDVWFRYNRNFPDVLCGLDFTVYENEICCILGGNGSGKSTAMMAASDLLKPYSGEIRVFGKRLREYKNQSLYRGCLTYLPQDVQTVFLCNTVREEIGEIGGMCDAFPFDLSGLLDKHPYDLSGGEMQLAALAKVLACEPKILLLDEPTKGLDAHAKKRFTEVVRNLKKKGMTVVIVTHDIEFAAVCADRCAMMFRGTIVSEGIPRTFFAENSFYTTAVGRMTKGYYDNAVTVEDAAELCMLNSTEDGV